MKWGGAREGLTTCVVLVVALPVLLLSGMLAAKVAGAS